VYEYACRIVNVYDGDTVKVDIDLGFIRPEIRLR